MLNTQHASPSPAITCSAPLCCQSVIQTRVASGHVPSSEVLYFRFCWNRWVGTLVGRHAYALGSCFLPFEERPHMGMKVDACT
jgi:hypothetical protein